MKQNPITARNWAAYDRCNRELASRANSRPILNPNGPTTLIPAWSASERAAQAKRLTNAN